MTVRSVAIALGEFPAAVAAAESNRKAASRGRGTTSDSSYSDYRGKKKSKSDQVLAKKKSKKKSGKQLSPPCPESV